MKSVKFASLIACYSLLVVNVQAYPVTEETTKYIRDGENITLSCSGEINAMVTWMFKQTGSSFVIGLANNAVSKNSTKYSATYNGEDGVYTFTVHTFSEISDAGQYLCLMSLTYSEKKEVIFTVIVPEGPTSASITGNTPVFADGSTSQLTLTCTATAIPAVTFEWRNRGDITGDNTNTLTLSHLEKSDNEANITCTAINTKFNEIRVSHAIILTVYYACKAAMWVSETNPSEGDDVTVVCTCDSNPAATFTIKRPTGEQFHQSRQDIQDIVRTDTGEYVCTVGNTYGNQTKKIDILVNYAPDIKVTLPVTTSAGDRGVHILCEADGIPNSYNFGKWRQLGPTDYKEIQILHGSHSGNQSLLTFDKPLTYEDSGFYECNVNNGVFGKGGVLVQSVKKYLEVMGAPNILKNENLTYGKIGQDVKVEVSFYSVPEFTIVTWFILSDSGQQNIVDISLDIQQTVEQRTLSTTFHGVSVNVNGYVATLLFKIMTVDNIGTYVAVISNDKGLASYTKKLKLKQNMMNTKENVESPAIGVVAGSAAGASIIVVIIVIVVVMLCKRGVITKPKSACLKGNENSTNNVYMNQAFSPVTDESGHADESEYQELGPSVNPHMDYESLTSSDIPTENIISEEASSFIA